MVPITKNVISLVQKNGFQVLDIITDNHRINRSLFTNLTNNLISFSNPEYPNCKLLPALILYIYSKI